MGTVSRSELLRARQVIRDWIDEERKDYADVKYDLDLRELGIEKMREEGINDYWMTFLTNYLSRVQQLDIRSSAGKQAMGKFIVTALSCLEAALLATNEKMPAPGKASGDVEEWRRP